MESIKEKLNNQDFIQKSTSISLFSLELYRVLVSTLLILFVPQKCGNEENVHVCSYEENMKPTSTFYNVALIINFITMVSFVSMYMIELKRENQLINYLEVNTSKPCDNESVGKALETLPKHRKENILFLDKYYYRASILCILLFGINTILSGLIIYDFYLDNQTTTTFVTNILFMITKLGDIYGTINTNKNIFYSAYLKTKVQYNDVDPEKSESFRTLEATSKEEVNIEIIENGNKEILVVTDEPNNNKTKAIEV